VKENILSYLKMRWEEFIQPDEIHFYAEPIQREQTEFSKSPCKYCKYKKICHGYQIGYENEKRASENSEFLNYLKPLTAQEMQKENF
jgi:radical SAM protein with 4Fe4S-binding SPASM domain